MNYRENQRKATAMRDALFGDPGDRVFFKTKRDNKWQFQQMNI